MDKLAVRVLRELDIDGVDLQTLGSRKGRTLLWLLALGRGSAVPIHSLLDALWPDGAPSRPADQLAVLVSRLRAVLGRDRITRTDSGYRLVYDWLDLDKLDAVTTETAQRLSERNAVGASSAARVVASLLSARLRHGLIAEPVPQSNDFWQRGEHEQIPGAAETHRVIEHALKHGEVLRSDGCRAHVHVETGTRRREQSIRLVPLDRCREHVQRVSRPADVLQSVDLPGSAQSAQGVLPQRALPLRLGRGVERDGQAEQAELQNVPAFPFERLAPGKS